MKSDLFSDVFPVPAQRLRQQSYHQANIYFTNWVTQAEETESFCALIGVNYQIM